MFNPKNYWQTTRINNKSLKKDTLALLEKNSTRLPVIVLTCYCNTLTDFSNFN